MNLPTYIRAAEFVEQNYHEELNQTLRDNLSDNGYILPSVTDNQLRIDNVIDVNGNVTTLDAMMPDGTLWYVSDANAIVAKINGALRQLDNSAYP